MQGLDFLAIALWFLGTLLIFLIGRELVMWYWKINKHIRLQEEILAELKVISGRNKTD